MYVEFEHDLMTTLSEKYVVQAHAGVPIFGCMCVLNVHVHVYVTK